MKTLMLDHVGIAVASIDAALGFYQRVLGLKLEGIESVEEQKVKTAFLPAGDLDGAAGLGGASPGGAGGGEDAEAPGRPTDIELLESTDPEGPIAKFISAKGEGVHHLAFRVDDLDAALAECEAAGIRLIDRVPRRGAGGSRIAFIHPKSANGVLVELCERMA